jgi:hypothetical protein
LNPRPACTPILRALCIAAMFLFASAPVCAAVRVQVMETDPESPATLGHWEKFYLRIAYETDRPITMRVEPYAGATPEPAADSGSQSRGPGKGEAAFWIAYTEPARVDRIVVQEIDAMQQPIAQAEMAVDLTWTGRKTAAPRPRPEWVVQFEADRVRLQKEMMQARADRPLPWWETALFVAAVLSIPIYFIVQVVVLWRWRGGWRIAAAVPAVPMTLFLGHAILAAFAGSNLAPIFLIFTCLPALIDLLALSSLRRFVLRT